MSCDGIAWTKSASGRGLSVVLGAALACGALGCGSQELPLRHSVVFVHQKPVLPEQDDRPVPLILFRAGGAIYSTFSNFTGPDLDKLQPIGSHLVRLDPDGSLDVLGPVRGVAVRDPEVSYDAKTILFAMKRGSRGKWQIHEIGADGRNLRRISRDDRYNDFEPAYVPDGRIVFLSDRPKLLDPIFQQPSAQLHLMRPDGSGVVQLSTEPGGEFNPTVSSDGRLLFTRWNAHYGPFLREGDLPPPFAKPIDRFLAWKIALDGTSNAHPVFGEHVLHDFSGGFLHVREVPDGTGRLVATLADEYGTFGAGSIVRLDPRDHADLQRIDFLTPDVHQRFEPDVDGRYRSPYPLEDGRILAVYSDGPVTEFNFGRLDLQVPVPPRRGRRIPDLNLKPPHFKLVLLPPQGSGRPEELYETKGSWAFWPVELAPRPVPQPDPGTARPGFAYGILNSRDVFLRNRNVDLVLNGDAQPIPAPGEAVAVQVFAVDFVLVQHPEDPELKIGRERLLGEAPVEADGSFAAAVPAGVPLFWRTVRTDGSAVVEEPFLVEVRPGQILTCNGCHSPHDGRQGRTTNQALSRPKNLTGLEIDQDHDGVIDLLKALR
jgi:hypothetical protein